MKRIGSFLTAVLAVCVSNGSLKAQTDVKAKPALSVQTFYLNNLGQESDANEIQNAVRNLLPPDAKVYYVPNQHALVTNITAEQLEIAKKVLADLSQPRKIFRLTYTLTETDGGKRLGVQHFAMVVSAGQRTILKQGSRVPIVTGSVNAPGSSVEKQVTYLDIGLLFDATLDESSNGVRLRTRAEQSSVAEERSGVGSEDPIVRQTSIEGTAILTPGKPLILGSLDIPGSTRHQDVEVVMEVVK